MKKTTITLFAAALLLAWASAVFAQTACEDALHDAEKAYELGLFEDVPTKLSPCLGTPTSRALAVHVHSLLARAYLNNDEPEKARKEVSTILRLQSSYEAEAGSSGRFLALVAQVRREEQTTQVASVSKTNESLREAPATVVVITADEIRRRGYLDLEQLLHDLPGFDISLVNGDGYSSIYQRGYRSPSNDRLLLLVDGVEQSDLSTNIVYLSRQYPVSYVDRVEVIYGPASTMYGANAYTGVISILTKEPETLLPDEKGFGLTGQVTGGGYQSRSADLTLAGRDGSGTVAWSIAGTFQAANERDLSRLDDWDYTYKNIDYKNLMRLSGPDADQFVAEGHCATPSPNFQCIGSTPGNRTIELTTAGEDLVRGIDSQFIRDHGLGFNDHSRNSSLFGKLRISNLTLGMEVWRRQEGIASANKAIWITGDTSWLPKMTAFYLKYNLPLDKFKVNVFTRYEQTTVDKNGTHYDYLHNYANGFYLNMFSLVAPCQAPRDPLPVSCAPATPWVEQVSYGSLSTQLRSELTMVYTASDKLNAVAGFEYAKSSIQSQYQTFDTGPGYILPGPGNPEQIEHTDEAIYAQGSYTPRRSLKFVLAGRLTHNEINNKPGASGFGTLFTPRAGVIYSPGNRRLVLKAIYSEAFKDPTDSQKFGTLKFVNEFPSNGLVPEKVRNTELSAGYEIGSRLSVEGSLYEARYSNVVNFGLVPDCPQFVGCLQYQNRDLIRIRGLQTTARYRRDRAEFWGNYTHTSPVQENPKDLFGAPLLDQQGKPISELRVADIASDRVNVGVDADWLDRLRTSLRVNYVGRRKTGEGTTVPANPFTSMAPYTTTALTVSYRYLPNATVELIADNLLNKQYYDPGIEFQIGTPRVLQAGRTLYLRLTYGLSLGGSRRTGPSTKGGNTD